MGVFPKEGSFDASLYSIEGGKSVVPEGEKELLPNIPHLRYNTYNLHEQTGVFEQVPEGTVGVVFVVFVLGTSLNWK